MFRSNLTLSTLSDTAQLKVVSFSPLTLSSPAKVQMLNSPFFNGFSISVRYHHSLTVVQTNQNVSAVVPKGGFPGVGLPNVTLFNQDGFGW